MTERRFQIEHIPAVLYGDAAEKAYFHTPEQLAALRNWEETHA